MTVADLRLKSYNHGKTISTPQHPCNAVCMFEGR